MSSNENKVIHPRRIPTKLPIMVTIQAALIYKVFEVDGWQAVLLTSIVTIIWIYKLSRFSAERYHDPYSD